MSPADFAERVAAYFEDVHRDVFDGDPASNPALGVEVIGAAMAHDTPVAVMIAPWTLCGLAVPPHGGLPTSLRIGPKSYPVLANEVEQLGRYHSVVLVPDVSGYASRRDARAVADPLAQGFRTAVAKAREELTEVEDARRRSILTGSTDASPPPGTAFGSPEVPEGTPR